MSPSILLLFFFFIFFTFSFTASQIKSTRVYSNGYCLMCIGYVKYIYADLMNMIENEQENITNKMTSPQQILSTVNQVKLEPYEEFFDPQYSINQDQSSHTDAIKYKWTGGVTSEMIGQGFNHNQPHPFDSMYENNDSNQIPFHYCENPSPQQQQQQQNNSIGMGKLRTFFCFANDKIRAKYISDSI